MKSGIQKIETTIRVGLFGLKASGKTWLQEMGVPFATNIVAGGHPPWITTSKAGNEASDITVNNAWEIKKTGVAAYIPTLPDRYKAEPPVYLLKRSDCDSFCYIELIDFAGEFADNPNTEKSKEALSTLSKLDGIIWCLDVLKEKQIESSDYFDSRKIRATTESVNKILETLKGFCAKDRITLPVAFCITKIDLLPQNSLGSESNWREVAEILWKELGEIRKFVLTSCEYWDIFCVSSCGFTRIGGQYFSNLDGIRILNRTVIPVGLNHMLSWIISHSGGN